MKSKKDGDVVRTKTGREIQAPKRFDDEYVLSVNVERLSDNPV